MNAPLNDENRRFGDRTHAATPPDEQAKPTSAGMVYLIGAGPGDPGLLTIRGADLLRTADVVLYDGLSNPELLAHASDAELICVGKHGRSRIWRQTEIIDEMLRHAACGKRVARLKGGDTAVFARTAEEVDALQTAGVSFEVVPGITAALAAGTYAGIPITHRGLSSAVALVTGHEEPGKSESALDWDALAKFPGTLAIYMGVTTAGTWTAQLIAGGKQPSTPTAIVRRCSHHDQQLIRCRLDEIPAILGPSGKLRPPVIVIIGPVTAETESMNWFDQRPLFGQTVLVTRPANQADELASPLRDLGARVLVEPLIRINPPDDWTAIDNVIERLHDYDAIAFCSSNGVRAFCQRLWDKGYDGRKLAGIKIASVGDKTAAALNEFRLQSDIVPATFRAAALGTEIAAQNDIKNVLVIRASRGNDDLESSLNESGHQVHRLVVYKNSDVDELSTATRDAITRGEVDWITVTSSATAANLHRLLGDQISHIRLASLSPVTSQTLRDLGHPPAAEAKSSTIPELIKAIADIDRPPITPTVR